MHGIRALTLFSACTRSLHFRNKIRQYEAMGFRFRKSFKVMPGVRINLSKTGVGASVGFKGFRMTKRADGRVQRTVSIPGTGVSHVESHAAGGSFESNKNLSPTGATQPKTAGCPSCGHRYKIGKANFCAQCGVSLGE